MTKQPDTATDSLDRPANEPIEITDAMIAAGVKEAWHGGNPPEAVIDLVGRVYRAMTVAARRA